MTVSMNSRDGIALICREGMNIALDSYKGQKPFKQFAFRYLFKPETGTLWGYHQMHVPNNNLLSKLDESIC